VDEFRKKTDITSASCWLFLFLLTLTCIFPLGSTMMADRYAYFSLMGFCLALGHGICAMNKRAVGAMMVVICLSFAAIDMQRNAVWNNLLSLYMQMTRDAPERSIGFTNVGMYYYERGDLANAERYLEASCTKKGIVIRDALQYLAAVYWEGKKHDKALSVLNRMMTLEPENPQPYIMASRIYENMGDSANAKVYYDKVVARFPGIEGMMQQRVISLCREGEQLMSEHKPAEAERKFNEALMMKPDFVPALIDSGGLAAERGEHARALSYFNRAATLDPANPSVRYNLSLVYEMMGNHAAAQREMERYRALEARTRPQVTAPE
jgi:Flp pilus assembly protein TadD